MKRKRSVWIALLIAVGFTSTLAFVGISGFSCSWAKIESSALEEPSKDEGDAEETDKEKTAFEKDEKNKSKYEDRLTYIEKNIERLREENRRSFEYYSEGINRISIFVTIFGLMIAVFVPIIVFSLGFFFKRESEDSLRKIVSDAEKKALDALDRAESIEKHIQERIELITGIYQAVIKTASEYLPSIYEMDNTGLETVSASSLDGFKRVLELSLFASHYLYNLCIKGHIVDNNVLIDLSKTLYFFEHFDETASVLLKIIGKNGDIKGLEELKFELVLCYIRMGDYDNAINRLDELVLDKPNEIRYLFRRAKVYNAKGDILFIDEIIGDLGIVFEADPRYVDRVLSTNEFGGISETREFQQLMEEYPRDAEEE